MQSDGLESSRSGRVAQLYADIFYHESVVLRNLLALRHSGLCMLS